MDRNKRKGDITHDDQRAEDDGNDSVIAVVKQGEESLETSSPPPPAIDIDEIRPPTSAAPSIKSQDDATSQKKQLLFRRKELSPRLDVVCGLKGRHTGSVFTETIERMFVKYNEKSINQRFRIAQECLKVLRKQGVRFLRAVAVEDQSLEEDGAASIASDPARRRLYTIETSEERILEKIKKALRYKHKYPEGNKSELTKAARREWADIQRRRGVCLLEPNSAGGAAVKQQEAVVKNAKREEDDTSVVHAAIESATTSSDSPSSDAATKSAAESATEHSQSNQRRAAGGRKNVIRAIYEQEQRRSNGNLMLPPEDYEESGEPADDPGTPVSARSKCGGDAKKPLPLPSDVSAGLSPTTTDAMLDELMDRLHKEEDHAAVPFPLPETNDPAAVCAAADSPSPSASDDRIAETPDVVVRATTSATTVSTNGSAMSDLTLESPGLMAASSPRFQRYDSFEAMNRYCRSHLRGNAVRRPTSFIRPPSLRPQFSGDHLLERGNIRFMRRMVQAGAMPPLYDSIMNGDDEGDYEESNETLVQRQRAAWAARMERRRRQRWQKRMVRSISNRLHAMEQWLLHRDKWMREFLNPRLSDLERENAALQEQVSQLEEIVAIRRQRNASNEVDVPPPTPPTPPPPALQDSVSGVGVEMACGDSVVAEDV